MVIWLGFIQEFDQSINIEIRPFLPTSMVLTGYISIQYVHRTSWYFRKYSRV